MHTHTCPVRTYLRLPIQNRELTDIYISKPFLFLEMFLKNVSSPQILEETSALGP